MSSRTHLPRAKQLRLSITAGDNEQLPITAQPPRALITSRRKHESFACPAHVGNRKLCNQHSRRILTSGWRDWLGTRSHIDTDRKRRKLRLRASALGRRLCRRSYSPCTDRRPTFRNREFTFAASESPRILESSYLKFLRLACDIIDSSLVSCAGRKTNLSLKKKTSVYGRLFCFTTLAWFIVSRIHNFPRLSMRG